MADSELRLSQYRITRRLGAGGMAEVFLAEQLGAAGFSRPVAIKTILAGGAPPDAIALFLDEARVAAGLQHPAIVQTLDLGFDNETLFIVMEYVPGPPLSRIVFEMKRTGRFLSPAVVAYVGARMASALDFAHRKVTAASGQPLNLVHRDVSPQNILITREGHVKLTDFGVARASIQMHRTKTGQVRGKAAYMAPEQVRAKELDGRTDMFALGLVLYEALTGVRPYQRKSDIQSMRAILKEDVPPLLEKNPNVPDELVKVIMRCLEKSPAARYAHCGELEAALRNTYRSQRESSVEKSLVDTMSELFGPEQWLANVDGPAVESWQPTVSIGTDGRVTAPKLQRLTSSVLSPEVAALLGQTPRTPASGDDAASQLDNLSTGPAGGLPETGSMAFHGMGGTPQAPMGTWVTPETALAQTALRASGMYSQGASIVSPMIPSTFGMTAELGMPPGDTGAVAEVRQRGSSPLLIAAFAAALVLTGAVAFVVLGGNDTTTRSLAPAKPAAQAGAREGLVATPGATAPEPPPERASVPQPEAAPAPAPVQPRQKERRPPRPAAPAAPEPPPPPVERPPLTAAELKPRVLALKQKADARGDQELGRRLSALLIDLSIGAKPTERDRDLVEEAERKLR